MVLKVKTGHWQTLRRSGAGQQIAEAALVLPIVFLLLIGIYWFGLVFHIYASVNYAAREGARMAVSPTCATCTNEAPDDAAIANKVTSTLQASHLDPEQIAPYSTVPSPIFCPGVVAANACTSPGKITVCRGVKLNPNSAATVPSVCGISISFQYPFQFHFPFTSLDKQLIWLKTNVQMRSEE